METTVCELVQTGYWTCANWREMYSMSNQSIQASVICIKM